jgi:hypothetical protein
VNTPAQKASATVSNCNIALFDILGFKKLIESSEASATLDVLSEFVNFATLSLEYGVPPQGRISIRVFQDTLVAYTVSDSAEDLRCLVSYCCIVIAGAFHRGIFLRGAITSGPVLISDYAILGRAFVLAYEMEQAQNWAGAWVDEKCITPVISESLGSLVVRYAIPLKKGPVQMAWVLNWPLIICQYGLKHLAEGWDILVEQGESTWDSRQKIQEVDMFLTHLVHHAFEPEPEKGSTAAQHVRPTWEGDLHLYLTALPEYQQKFAKFAKKSTDGTS